MKLQALLLRKKHILQFSELLFSWNKYERLLLEMKPTKSLELWKINDSKILQTEGEIN